MNRRQKRASTAFTLVEILIAILFISIGFFGYIALHSRLLHSGQRLEEKEIVRAATGMIESIEFTRALLGFEQSIDGSQFRRDSLVKNLVFVSTDSERRNQSWLNHFPEEFRLGADETLAMEVAVYKKPFVHKWRTR